MLKGCATWKYYGKFDNLCFINDKTWCIMVTLYTVSKIAREWSSYSENEPFRSTMGSVQCHGPLIPSIDCYRCVAQLISCVAMVKEANAWNKSVAEFLCRL